MSSSEASIEVIAAPAAVLAVVADFAAYPQWAASVRSAEPQETGADGRATRVRIVIDAGIVKDDYVLAYDWHGDDGVSWHLVSGKMQKAQRGSYSLAATDDGGTEVTYQLEIDLAVPMPGLIKRKAEKAIMDTALKDLKKRVESLAADAGA